MDFSDYPKDHPNFDLTNKKKLGYFKDELNGVVIEEFIALKPKMYCIKSKGEENKKAKGIPKHKVKKKILISINIFIA